MLAMATFIRRSEDAALITFGKGAAVPAIEITASRTQSPPRVRNAGKRRRSRDSNTVWANERSRLEQLQSVVDAAWDSHDVVSLTPCDSVNGGKC